MSLPVFARLVRAQHFAHQGMWPLTLLMAREQMTQSVRNGMPTRSIGTISVLSGTYLLAPLAMDKSIEISFNAEPDIKVNADPERLFQVLSNLIGNAIKFTPKLGKIGVAAMSNGSEIVFTVRDSGEGIPPEQLPHIFERYWTVKEGNPTSQ